MCTIDIVKHNPSSDEQNSGVKCPANRVLARLHSDFQKAGSALHSVNNSQFQTMEVDSTYWLQSYLVQGLTTYKAMIG